jgi:hypothetical protein
MLLGDTQAQQVPVVYSKYQWPFTTKWLVIMLEAHKLRKISEEKSIKTGMYETF